MSSIAARLSSARMTTVIVFAVSGLLPFVVFAQEPVKVPARLPGLHSLTLPRANEPTIHYAISIPDNYSPRARVPLILALHFGVGAGSSAGAGRDVVEILIGPALAELGAIIVAPDSMRGDWSTPENESAVKALLDMVLASYSIDTKKLVVTGFSMGGTGSWHFAAAYPERFSAAIPIAGRPPESAAGWRLPVLAIHSRNDQVAPIGPTETRIAELRESGVNARLVALTGITHYETYRFADGLRQAVPWLREIWK
jgi:predicted peptidase